MDRFGVFFLLILPGLLIWGLGWEMATFLAACLGLGLLCIIFGIENMLWAAIAGSFLWFLVVCWQAFRTRRERRAARQRQREQEARYKIIAGSQGFRRRRRLIP